MENGEKTKRALTDTVEQLYSDKTRPNVPSQTRLSIREKKQCPICGKSFTTGSKLEVGPTAISSKSANNYLKILGACFLVWRNRVFR